MITWKVFSCRLRESREPTAVERQAGIDNVFWDRRLSRKYNKTEKTHLLCFAHLYTLWKKWNSLSLFYTLSRRANNYSSRLMKSRKPTAAERQAEIDIVLGDRRLSREYNEECRYCFEKVDLVDDVSVCTCKTRLCRPCLQRELLLTTGTLVHSIWWALNTSLLKQTDHSNCGINNTRTY